MVGISFRPTESCYSCSLGKEYSTLKEKDRRGWFLKLCVKIISRFNQEHNSRQLSVAQVKITNSAALFIVKKSKPIYFFK